MAGFLSGLASLGLKNLENMDIYEEPQKEGDKGAKPAGKTEVKPEVEEKDLIYVKTLECPVCGRNFPTKIVKTGKAKLLSTDYDLRPRYEGIDMVKYDVQVCLNCGYAALSRFFPMVSSSQAKLIRENISKSVRLRSYDGETYSYEEALERYQLALANAVVKHAKNSEKAYTCLKTAWLLRTYAESMAGQWDRNIEIEQIKAEEDSYLENAYNGFLEARKQEQAPICGMDEVTVDYLIAVLAHHLKHYDVAARMVSVVLVSHSATSRMKDRARELKDQILAETSRKPADV